MTDEIKKAGKSEKHKALQRMAIGWLYAQGCSIFAEEVPTRNGVADALGVRTRSGEEAVYYIEAKASRSDLICLKQKAVYMRATGGNKDDRCFYHSFKVNGVRNTDNEDTCESCINIKKTAWDTGIDFYYLIVADGVLVEQSLYPNWGVIDERGKVVRRARRMKRELDTKALIENIAHVLVYKVFGKMYSMV